MLTQKLDVKDLQFEKMKPFDGTTAYAQNKRQQVVMTEEYAKRYPRIHFSSMHPGWADTPGEEAFWDSDALHQIRNFEVQDWGVKLPCMLSFVRNYISCVKN